MHTYIDVCMIPHSSDWIKGERRIHFHSRDIMHTYRGIGSKIQLVRPEFEM